MKRLGIIYLIFTIIFIVITARLAYIQLVTDKYILNAENTSIKKVVTHPRRGNIWDREGKLLVTNDFDYDLEVTPELLEQKSFDRPKFFELVDLTPTQYDSILEQIKKTKNYSSFNNYPFKKGLSVNERAALQEKIFLFPAFQIVKRPVRRYNVNSAGHLLGYINEANPAYIKKDSTYYEPGDYVGISGVEKSYEKELRGVKGIQYVQKDISLKTIGPFNDGKSDVPMKSGKDITLTIDYELQAYAEQLMKGKRGAVVAIEPKTGEILVLASSPYIDPNDMTIPELRNSIIKDSINKIAINRATQGEYPPGSPFKLMTGLAALQMGAIVDTATTYTCRGGFRSGGLHIGCHCGTYYPIKLKTAIQRSCNNFFSSTYRDMIRHDSLHNENSFNEWHDIMESFNLNKYFGNDLATGSKGLIPSVSYYEKKIGELNVMRFISNGMGQGEILTTPLQMANYTAAIANKGYYYTPHIVKKIEDGHIKKKFKKKNYSKVDPKHFNTVLEGMTLVVQSGTARRMKSKYFTQAGKTGTAENPHGQDHSLFVLIAPVEDPQIVVATIVENGHYGATFAAPISSLVAEKYVTDTIRRKYLERNMMSRNLNAEYKRQWIRYLKRKGLYIEPKPKKIDSLKPKSEKTDSSVSTDKLP